MGTQNLKKVPMGTRVPKWGPTWEQCMSPDPLRQLHVLWHDSHPFSMDCTEVGVLKQPYNISLHPLLQSREGCCLDTEGGGILQHQTPGKSLERKVIG